MIEICARTHTLRMFATELSYRDVFKLCLYTSYRGPKEDIPWFYVVKKGQSCSTDLKQSMDDILASMKSNTRNEVRRAIKEGCEVELVESVDDFVPFYNAFCESKGLPDFTSKARMSKYPGLLLTKVVHDGKVLAMHANVLDERSKIAFLLYSCSPRLDVNVDRKMIGWGNKLLHFKDLEMIKNRGVEIYDWSGICVDQNDSRYSIGQFKLSFGGKLVDSWSLKTPMYALLESLRKYWIAFRR